VEVSGLPNANYSRRRPPRAETGVSLSRLPPGTRPRWRDAQADRRAVADPTRNGPPVLIRSLPWFPYARCRHLTGVEDDDSTGSSLRWFVYRL